jgi:hypothetical protein
MRNREYVMFQMYYVKEKREDEGVMRRDRHTNG